MPESAFDIGQKDAPIAQAGPEPPAGGLTPSLRVCMLGLPDAAWAGYTLDIPRRQIRPVLYRLATPFNPLVRDHLYYPFWSDTPEHTIHRNVSHILYYPCCLFPTPEIWSNTAASIALNPEQTRPENTGASRGSVLWLFFDRLLPVEQSRMGAGGDLNRAAWKGRCLEKELVDEVGLHPYR